MSNRECTCGHVERDHNGVANLCVEMTCDCTGFKPHDWFTREAVTGLCPQCGAGWTGSPCSTCHYRAPVPVDFQARPFEPSPAPRDEAREPVEVWRETYYWVLNTPGITPPVGWRGLPGDYQREQALIAACNAVAAAPRADPPSEAATWEAAAKECDDGAVGPGVMFEWEGTLYALGKNGVAALRVMAVGFRANAAAARAPGANT